MTKKTVEFDPAINESSLISNMRLRQGSVTTVLKKSAGISPSIVKVGPLKEKVKPTIFEEGEVSTTTNGRTKSNSGFRFRLNVFLLVLGAIYIVLPFWFSSCPWIRRQIIFLNNINIEFFVDMTSPQNYGLTCSQYFVLETEYGAKLGGWHIPPRSLVEEGGCISGNVSATPQGLDFSFDRPVILYFHGTGFSRAAFFRREFYRMITNSIDAYVVAFDYRGFGDSTNEAPRIPSVVEDADAVYHWLMKRVHPKNRVVIWGHSLGSGVAVQLAHKYAGKELSPPAVILESTFTNMEDAVKSFPFSALHRFWPFFENLVSKVAGYHADTYIANDDKMALAVASPILILHSADDMFLTVDLARKMYRLGHQAVDESLVNSRKGISSPKLFRPRYVEFEAHLGYGHKACTDPRIPEIFADFMEDIKRQNNETVF